MDRESVGQRNTYEPGPCHECGKPSIVIINKQHCCGDHLSPTLKRVLGPIKNLVELLKKKS